jgi:allantoinase
MEKEYLKVKENPRLPYSAITQRKDYDFPNKKRLAIYFAINLEHFSFGEGYGAELVPAHNQPDVLNWSWREYGNRVGIWRLLKLFEDFQFPSALLVNSSCYDHCPEVITAFQQRKDEIVAHGRTNSEKQGLMNLKEEQLLIEQTTEVIKSHQTNNNNSSCSPQGWLGPWISESNVTPELLLKNNYSYILDYCFDDQPVFLKSLSPIKKDENNVTKELLVIPYPQELNDIPTIAVRRASAEEFANMIIDNLDEMLLQCKEQPLVMGIALHPYIVGQPFRLKQLRRAFEHIKTKMQQNSDIWICTPGEINQFIRSNNNIQL